MVTQLLETIKTAFPDASATQVAYAERGYHLAVETSRENFLKVIGFFDGKAFCLEDLCCVDYGEYLELVCFFNRHESLCRVKTTLKLPPDAPAAPTISGIYPIAHWYEREVQEFYGVYFEGHPNPTYLFLHDGIDAYPLRKKPVPVTAEEKRRMSFCPYTEGVDSFYVNLGPQHPSTHGVLRVVVRMDGEYVLCADPVLGYLHRMHEKMAETRSYAQFLPNPSRMDYVGALSFNLAHVTAVEKLCGIETPARAQYIRTITCELNRIASHLLWLGSFLSDLGGLTPFLYCFDDREHILDILEAVTGSRLTYCYFRFGGLFNDVDEGFAQGVSAFVSRMRSRLPMYHTLISKNVIFINRVRDIGTLARENVRKYGCSGPVIRSTGIPFDMRKVEPYAAYPHLDFQIPVGERGDTETRYQLRMQEIDVSLGIIESALKGLPAGPVTAEKVPKKLKPPKGDLYHVVESARGQLGVYVVSDGTDTPYRMRWRVPSYSNLMTFPHLAEGTLLADAVAILGGMDLVIPEIDR